MQQSATLLSTKHQITATKPTFFTVVIPVSSPQVWHMLELHFFPFIVTTVFGVSVGFEVLGVAIKSREDGAWGVCFNLFWFPDGWRWWVGETLITVGGGGGGDWKTGGGGGGIYIWGGGGITGTTGATGMTGATGTTGATTGTIGCIYMAM